MYPLSIIWNLLYNYSLYLFTDRRPRFIFSGEREYRRSPTGPGHRSPWSSTRRPHSLNSDTLGGFPTATLNNSLTYHRERERERWAFNSQKHYLVLELPWDVPPERAARTMWKPHCWLRVIVWIFAAACWHRPHTPACRMASNERLYEVWMLYCNKVKCGEKKKKDHFLFHVYVVHLHAYRKQRIQLSVNSMYGLKRGVHTFRRSWNPKYVHIFRHFQTELPSVQECYFYTLSSALVWGYFTAAVTSYPVINNI